MLGIYGILQTTWSDQYTTLISDDEKIFGEKYNDGTKHMLFTSVKDVIYQKRKIGAFLVCQICIRKFSYNDVDPKRYHSLFMYLYIFYYIFLYAHISYEI